MKLPSISQRVEKPTSAQSQKNQKLPPKYVGTTSTNNNASLLQNLEKNLFKKLQQYDDNHNIKTSKQIQKENLTQSCQEAAIDTVMELYLSQSAKEKLPQKQISYNNIQYEETKQKVKLQEESEVVPARENIWKNDIVKKNQLKPIQPIQSIKKSTPQEQKQIKIGANQQTFLTGQVVNEEINKKHLEESSDEDIQNVQKRNKEKIELRRMLNKFQDEDLGKINNLLAQTTNEFNEHFSNIVSLNKSVTNLSNSVKTLGFNISSDLLEKLERQYQDLVDIQKEDDVLYDYDVADLKERRQSRTSNQHQQVQQKQKQSRASSLAQTKHPLKKGKPLKQSSISDDSDQD